MTKHGGIMARIKTSNGEVGMKVKMSKLHNSDWKRKIGLVLIFTMLLGMISPALYHTQSAYATITYNSAGAIAYSAANGATVAPAHPASIAAGDLLVLIIGMKPSAANSGSVTTPAGWNLITSIIGAGGYGTTLAADTGNTNLFAYSKVAVGGETGTLTVDVATNSVSWAQIYRYSKTTGEWSIAGSTGSDITTGTAVSIAFSSNPGVTNGDHILGAMCVPTDVTTPAQFTAEAFTQAGMTFAAATELSEPDSTNGNDIGGFVARTNATAGTSTGNPTMTATAAGTTTNVRGPGVFIRIRETAVATAPVAGTVTVSPSANGYTSASPTITATFTEDASPITGCEYTTNGSTWVGGVLSGTFPDYTCTANPVGLFGSLTINMRATSAGGGTGTGSPVNLTVDATGPTGAALTATAGDGEVGLSWTCTDAGMGMCTFKLVRSSTPPADCTGAALYQGDATVYTDDSVVNETSYGYRVCVLQDGAGNTSTASSTATAMPSVKTGKIVSCSRCHDYPPKDGTRSGTTGSVVGDHAKHQYVCSTCHVTPGSESSTDFAHRDGNIQMQTVISGGSYTRGTSFAQTNILSTTGCSNISCHGGNNPTPQWGVGTASCVDCHSTTAIVRTKGVPGGTLDPVTDEFGMAWGHKKSGRTAVSAADCIVCHLEGKYTSGVGSAVITASYHADGNIDLRDPDGAGETPITNISGGAFTFQKFSTSYSAGSRTYNGNTLNTIDNVLTQNFCLACHDSDGATNTTARSNNGGTGSATMPFGGIQLGANYTATNGAIGTQGLINVYSQFSTTYSSVHPVRGSLNRDFPTKARLASPYNNQAGTRVDAGGTKTLSVVINCFDCHNASGTPLTTRTIVAHGYTTTPLRGTVYNNGTNTLCTLCHTGYTSDTTHLAGSAASVVNGNGGEGMATTCYNCHGDSGDSDGNTLPTTVRPVRAQNYHGFNTMVGGAAKWTAAAGGKPYAFIRNTVTFAGTTGYHRPLRGIGELTTGSATCMGGSGCAGQGAAEIYTPGGQF